MAGSVATVAGGLVGLASAGVVAAVVTMVTRRERPYLPGSIAVVPGAGADPLGVALHHGFAGVEVAVDASLALTGRDAGKGLAVAVLQPLADRVKPTDHGRVYPAQGEPFLLVLDLVSGEGADAYASLDALLREHASMLTRYVNGRVTRGAVTVILTGDRWPRTALAEAYERYAFVEGGAADLEPGGAPAGLVPLVRERLAHLVGWDPRDEWDELPAEARHLVRALVRTAHTQGRQVRFVDVPDTSRTVRRLFWRELLAADVDYIGGGRVAALARFLRDRGAHRRPTHARAGQSPAGSPRQVPTLE